MFFEKIYLSNIEHDAAMSIILFYHFCLGSVFRDIFFFFMYARPIPMQTKVHLKNLQFLAVTYDMVVLSCAFDVV